MEIMTEPTEINVEEFRALIKDVDDMIRDVQEFLYRADRELYAETLNIGEDSFNAAKLIVQKLQHKARGGGQIAYESSAVGWCEVRAKWLTDFRDKLQSEHDNYLGTDSTNADGYNSMGNNL
ncbi:MAG: hypothetical protein GX542_07115 [Rhodococcus sp.]|nr:hypothetical protein [Rhodococcus sp. (in: high G+C Gram-positive bacteria)]